MSDVRDISGRVPDYFLSPTYYVNNAWVWGPIDFVYLFDVNSRSLIPNYNLLLSQNPFDQYAFARNAYLAQREYRIHGQSAACGHLWTYCQWLQYLRSRLFVEVVHAARRFSFGRC